MPMLGDVFLNNVENEAPDYSADTSEHPIENATNIVDHIERKATTLSLSGVVVGSDSEQRKKKLLHYMESGTLLTFSYLGRYPNMVITSFQPDRNVDVANGFAFSISLKQIRVVQAAKITNLSFAIRNQSKSVGNKGRQQVQSR